MPRREEDFPASVRRAVASRVGYVCSNPNCRAPTSGPHSDANRANSVGEAAHIIGARPGSARYNESLTPELRRSVDNAIWLCRSCADLIDNDEVRYTERLVRAWKEAAEADAEAALGKARQNNQQSAPDQPSLNVLFANGQTDVELAADWEYAPPKENPKIERFPGRGDGRGVTVIYPFFMWYTPGKVPGTTPLVFRVENEAVIEAKHVEVAIRLPEGCRPVTVDMTEYAYKSERRKAVAEKDGTITIRLEHLLHSPAFETEQLHVAFPAPATEYELHWTTTAGNMRGEQTGTLRVRLLGKEVSPTGRFPGRNG